MWKLILHYIGKFLMYFANAGFVDKILIFALAVIILGFIWNVILIPYRIREIALNTKSMAMQNDYIIDALYNISQKGDYNDKQE